MKTFNEHILLSYSELITLPTFEERFNYLKLSGSIGVDTFGFNRYLNQAFYKSLEWKRIREQIILRDNACDLGIEDRMIMGRILIHHLNPISPEDLVKMNRNVIDPENLICVSHMTHNALHYSDESSLPSGLVERYENDTIPWKRL